MDLAYDGKGKIFRIDGVEGISGRSSFNSLNNKCYLLHHVKSVLHKDTNSLLSNPHLDPASALTPNPTLSCAAPVDNPDLVLLSKTIQWNHAPSLTLVLLDLCVGPWVPSIPITVAHICDSTVSEPNTPAPAWSHLDPLVKP